MKSDDELLQCKMPYLFHRCLFSDPFIVKHFKRVLFMSGHMKTVCISSSPTDRLQILIFLYSTVIRTCISLVFTGQDLDAKGNFKRKLPLRKARKTFEVCECVSRECKHFVYTGKSVGSKDYSLIFIQVLSMK
ncbi:hypothetical protein CHS0354_016244 [Potamilus streckersoni]|uniref:Uncharacterized protein n=1 Tax=Potamilus streckersoni TaxID=2493646 RepID=A0AAE0RXJ2_9BIVA|nr:hypothetical protein CHS0354_016244 [Potamilus streckersoni]